jgi:outer membrane lipoprotein carrier protein
MRKVSVFQMILAVGLVVACAAQPTHSEGLLGSEAAAKVPLKDSKKGKSPGSLLEEVEKRYVSTSALTAKIKKTLKLKLLEQERVQSGTIAIKKPGMFRLELDGTEKSLAISDAKTIWVVNYPTDPEFDKTVRIMRSQDPKKVQSQTLLAFILGQGSLLKQYKIKSQKEEGDIKTYQLEPKDKSEEVQGISIAVSISKKEIISLQYVDKIENVTTVEFSDNKFDQKLETKQFKFSPPANAEITDI